MPSAFSFVCDDLFTLEDVSVMANISLSAPFVSSSLASVKIVRYIDRRYGGQGCGARYITHNICKIIIIQAYFHYSCPSANLTSYTGRCLIQPIFSSSKLLLQVVYSVVNILPCSLDGNSLFFNQLWQLIGDDWCCRAILFISPMPVIVVVAVVNKGIRTNMELTSDIRPLLYNGTLPLVWLVAPARDFLWCLKQCLPQNNGPSHSSSPNVAIRFLP